MSSEMNLWRSMLLQAPDCESEVCAICGAPPGHPLPIQRHHIVPKGMGGRKEEGPTVCVCGFGNADGCHKKFHDNKIFMRYVGSPKHGHWEYVKFKGKGGTNNILEVIQREDLLDWKPCIQQDIYGMPLKGRAILNG